jgi:proteic killer suppression protein
MEEDETAGPRGADASRLRRILSFLQDMAGEAELRRVAGWTVHPPSAAVGGRWELRVAPVGALLSGIDAQDSEITDLDYEGNG